MKYYIVFSTCALLTYSSAEASAIDGNTNRGSGRFGAKINPNPRTLNQAKRDLSLSYAATNIDSKEGTRVKTITVIRNIGKNGKNDKLSINPELYKNEEWATAFRDNFDSYGVIPDVPDIDDLFDFVNNKKPKEPKTPAAVTPENKTEAPPEQPAEKHSHDENEKPVREPSAEEETSKDSDPVVDKIKGDAELLPDGVGGGGFGGGKKPPQKRLRSQSLSADNKMAARIRAPLIDVNYSTPHQSVQQHFEKYIQVNNEGYDYPKPCPHAPVSSINVNTVSGRTYDIPVDNGTPLNPYLAPAISKKGQVSPQSPPPVQENNSQNYPNAPSPANQQQPQPQATYSVNSLLPPLQSASASASAAGAKPQQSALLPPPQPQVSQNAGPSTSQRPYVAPNLRNSATRSSPQQAPTPIYNRSPTNFRSNVFGFGGGVGGAGKSNAARSRGLKY